MRGARGIVVVALAAGCGWTLPLPDVRIDARTDDAPVDAAAPPDAGAPNDVLSAMDVAAVRDVPVARDAGIDAPAIDAPRDAGAPDGSDDRTGPLDLGRPDGLGDAGPVDDRPSPVDLGVDSGVASCMPGERRSCYPGPPASRGRGYCRDGVETCDPGGRWSGACLDAVLPDCADRRCGSDDCGGTCGASCAAGQVCDDLGHCGAPSCGATHFTETCDDGSLCPSNSNCTADNLCACRPGYVGRTCAGVDCGVSCAYPNWYCARASFCGAGAISCAGGVTCPRHATCAAGGQCVCAPGFVAVTCAGDRCTSCPGTDYRCVPAT